MKILLLLITVLALLTGCSSSPKVGPHDLKLADFGAVGDGKTDDIAALKNALDALKAARPGATLHFEPGKIYKLGVREDSMFQIDLTDYEDVTVDGHGSMLLSTPKQAFFRIRRSEGVTVKNLVLESDPLSFTQGVVTDMNPDEGWFDVEVMAGYAAFPDVEYMKTQYEPLPWGAIMDPNERRIRPGMHDAYRLDRIEQTGPRAYRCFTQGGHKKGIPAIRKGDIYFQPLYFNSTERIKKMGMGDGFGNIKVTHSSNCEVENVIMYSGRSSMTSRLEYNTGPITFDRFQVRFRPGFDDRMVSNWRDGMHIKNNRVGPVIENCYFEGLLDDSINISSDTIMAAKVLSDRQFRLCNWRGVIAWNTDNSSVEVGDSYMAFYPDTGEYLGPFVIVEVDPNNRALVTFDKPVPNVVTGRIQRHVDNKATQFYNINVMSDGYIVRNNTFVKQRRDAIRARGTNGLIEENLVDGVNGNAVMLANDFGHFYEGPFSQNIVIRNNRFLNTEWTPIKAYTAPLNCPNPMVQGIVIENNEIVVKTEYAIELENVADVVIRNNTIRTADGPVMEQPVKAKNVSNLEMESN